MLRNTFLRSLLGAPALALGKIKESDEKVIEDRKEVLALHSNNDAASLLDDTKPKTVLKWTHDAEGNWYIENTATGKVTRL